MSAPGRGAHPDRFSFVVAALGVAGVAALALAIAAGTPPRLPSPPGTPRFAPDSTPGPGAAPARPRHSAGDNATRVEEATDVPVLPHVALVRLVVDTSTPASPPPLTAPVTPVDGGAIGTALLPARRLHAGSSAPLALSRAVPREPRRPAQDDGAVTSAFRRAGRQMRAGFRTVGRALDSVF